jgi:hypothetical protein
MKQQVSLLTQSKFYSPAFNGAIFDGPLRIYFAQSQESMALKVYFGLLNRFKDVIRNSGSTVFLMIYPSAESFGMSFPGDGADSVITESLDADYVVGVRGPLDEQNFDGIFSATEKMLTRNSRSEVAI